MSAHGVGLDRPGQLVLLSGNEAIARGALEAGVAYAASYPGSPSAEVLGTLAHWAKRFNLYAEWSTNEKVALEGAAAASFAGLRAIMVTKPDGLNVAFDFLTSLSYSGTRGGLVIVVADDPAGHSSTKEEDSRGLFKLAEVPVLEPSDFQEAKEMTRWAFALSEELGLPVGIRSVTRLSHARGNVTLGPLTGPGGRPRPAFRPTDRYITLPPAHAVLHRRLAAAARAADQNEFNRYRGPEGAALLVVTAGPGFRYAQEAVRLLGVERWVGVVKLGMSWPLPEEFLIGHLRRAREVLFLEEVDPFLEEGIRGLVAQRAAELKPLRFYGKRSGEVSGPLGPGVGELNVDVAIAALARVTGVAYRPRPQSYGEEARRLAGELPERDVAFCAGCPHRASFWALKAALELDGRRGVILGDIGCYSLGAMRTGHYALRTLHAMGSGVGLASGLGKLSRFGFDQPLVAVVGDSTFYHATFAALLNARYNGARFLLVVLDNGTTAMTGHQPHPGTGRDALGEAAEVTSVEAVAAALGIPVQVCDPYDVPLTTETVFELLQEGGIKILILRRACALLAPRMMARPRARVLPERCLGDRCGCNRFCSRAYGCPGIYWDAPAGTARVDQAVCAGCGVCADLCPGRAIVVEAPENLAPEVLEEVRQWSLPRALST